LVSIKELYYDARPTKPQDGKVRPYLMAFLQSLFAITSYFK